MSVDVFFRKLFENIDGGEDYFDDTSLVRELQDCGCIDFINNEIGIYKNSSNNKSKLSLSRENNLSFLRGSVFGYVLSKTGDRKKALAASNLAVEKAKK